VSVLTLAGLETFMKSYLGQIKNYSALKESLFTLTITAMTITTTCAVTAAAAATTTTTTCTLYV
jgi:hypothetical protein